MQNNIRKYTLFLLSALLVISSVSCSVYPRPEFADFATPPEPLKVFRTFEKNQLNSCTLCQTAVLEIKGRSISTIGLCSYDCDRNYIALSLLTPTGMKIIEFAEFNGKLRSVFVFPEISDGKKAADRIADDIKRIYLQPKKLPKYYDSGKNSVTLVWEQNKDKIHLRFGLLSGTAEKNQIVLLEKKIIKNGNIEAAVYYYDYVKKFGKLIPMRIRYENYKYKYNLTLKTNEIVEGMKAAEKH